MSVITGKAYWAFVNHTNNKFPKNGGGTWSIDIVNLTKEQIATLKTEGLTINNKGDERESYVTFKRYEFRKDLSPNDKPIVEDTAGNTFTKNVGNGSIVDVRYRLYEYNIPSGGTGIGGDLSKIRIRELVAYGDSDDDFEEIEGGFVAGATGIDSDDVADSMDDKPEKVA